MVDAENLSAREAAERWFEEHPLRDPSKNSVIRALVRFIEDDRCIVWPSALRLHHRTGLSEDTVERVLADFDRTGLTVRVEGTGARGGSIVRRIDYQRSNELYPDGESWAECKARAESKKPSKKTKVPAWCGNIDATKVPAWCGNNDAASVVKFPQTTPEVPATANGSSRNEGGEVPANDARSSRMVRDEGFRVYEGLKQGYGGALNRRASCLAALPEKENSHAQKNVAVQRSKKTALLSQGDALTPAEVRERAKSMMSYLRALGVIKRTAVPAVIAQWAADPRVDIGMLAQAFTVYCTDRDPNAHQSMREFASMVAGLRCARSVKRSKGDRT